MTSQYDRASCSMTKGKNRREDGPSAFPLPPSRTPRSRTGWLLATLAANYYPARLLHGHEKQRFPTAYHVAALLASLTRFHEILNPRLPPPHMADPGWQTTSRLRSAERVAQARLPVELIGFTDTDRVSLAADRRRRLRSLHSSTSPCRRALPSKSSSRSTSMVAHATACRQQRCRRRYRRVHPVSMYPSARAARRCRSGGSPRPSPWP